MQAVAQLNHLLNTMGKKTPESKEEFKLMLINKVWDASQGRGRLIFNSIFHPTHAKIGDAGVLMLLIMANHATYKKAVSKIIGLQLVAQNITDKGTEYLARLLTRNDKLKYLDLRHNEISDVGATQLENALRSHPYYSVDLDSNNIGDIGVQALANALNNNVQHLYLAKNQIGNKGAEALGDMLSSDNKLEQLHLDNNEIGDEGATKLAYGLLHNSSLWEIDLNGNKIGNKGANELATMLRSNNKLQTLGLRSNKIGDEGAEELVAALQSNTVLYSLQLQFNSPMTETLASEINEKLNLRNRRMSEIVEPAAKNDLRPATTFLKY